LTDETTRLVDAARTGDRDAMASLLFRHQGRLLSLLRARLRGELARRVTPEDVLQETLLEASRRIGAFEHQGPASFYRWLVGIARFKLSEAGRAQRALKRTPDLALESGQGDGATSLGGQVARREGALRIHDALANLPERQAEAIRLRYLEGLSVRETAERLECSVPAAKALVTRALAELGERVAVDSR
jgi:RNA polymerase sigma-70 factor (ECF subfamily)